MPELTPQSIPSPAGDPPTWEDREGFRETLLLHFTRPGDADAMRRFGAMLYDSALLAAPSWPAWPESTTRTELGAAAADLRHLEGFLAAVGRERELSSLSKEDARLSRFAAREAREIAKIARRIGEALAPRETSGKEG